MSGNGSISVWIEGVKAGCESAATKLWRRYYDRLLRLARNKLHGMSVTVADEEDIVATAFQSFLCRCRRGSFPELRDRDDLWRLLIALTVHKARNQVRNLKCQKRGNGEPMVAFEQLGNTLLTSHEFISPNASPEVLTMVSDSLDHLLSILSDGELRQIVLYKLEGYSNDEVAALVGRSRPTVERRLRVVRQKWREEFED